MKENRGVKIMKKLLLIIVPLAVLGATPSNLGEEPGTVYRLTVSVEKNPVTDKDEIRYSNGTGNLTVRGTGGKHKIIFALDSSDSSEGWEFHPTLQITFDPILGPWDEEKGAGGGIFLDTSFDPVAQKIEFDDDLSVQDVGTETRYKYTLNLVKEGEPPLIDDPEIQNVREPKAGP